MVRFMRVLLTFIEFFSHGPSGIHHRWWCTCSGGLEEKLPTQIPGWRKGCRIYGPGWRSGSGWSNWKMDLISVKAVTKSPQLWTELWMRSCFSWEKIGSGSPLSEYSSSYIGFRNWSKSSKYNISRLNLNKII